MKTFPHMAMVATFAALTAQASFAHDAKSDSAYTKDPAKAEEQAKHAQCESRRPAQYRRVGRAGQENG